MIDLMDCKDCDLNIYDNRMFLKSLQFLSDCPTDWELRVLKKSDIISQIIIKNISLFLIYQTVITEPEIL